ncbi:hypothetical protein ACEN8I_20005 [Polaromonas sp. CT11-55]|uniref:hypothetical protein n=1 Tax=Polaromonas sp. CT11-55 TaxID=3243045 RepID=UPI0039A57007
MRISVFIIACLFSAAARADWPLTFVRVTCIPEARYFYFEYKPVSGPAALTDAQFDDRKLAARMRAWQRHGYFDPRKLDRNCSLPESTYSLRTSQEDARESGECGGAPSIKLNLLRNGSPVLQDVVLGDACLGGASVASVEITDGLDGWGSRKMTLCVTPAPGETPHCKYLSEDYKQITQAVPITSEAIERYAKER